MAATVINNFLFVLTAVLVTLSTPLLRVKVGAGTAFLVGEFLALAATLSFDVSGPKTPAEDLSGAEGLGFTSRARAGALAEPEDVSAENPALDGSTFTGLSAVISSDDAETTGAGVGSAVSKGEEACFRFPTAGCEDVAISAPPLEAEAAKLGCGACTGMLGAGTLGNMLGDEIAELAAAASEGSAL